MQNASVKTVKCYYNVTDKFLFVCQLTEKLYKSGRTGFILTQDEAMSALLDKKLWQFKKLSFIPHCRPEHPLASEACFIVDHRVGFFPQESAADFVFINMGTTIPEALLQKQMLVEIVSLDERDRQEGRERIRLYKQHQFVIEHFDMMTKA